MASYILKYYKDIELRDGRWVRLEIHKKSTGAAWIAQEIGKVMQSLRLDIQGQSADIDAPVVKTSLEMTFADAPDMSDAHYRKCGDWEEFYTSDSTLWKVILKGKDSEGASYRTMWSGFITPDSYSEELRYRGSVTLIARDNIGHMQDFPFDAEGDADGMISLRELVQAAWAKIESPMELVWRASDWLETGGVEAFNTVMNVSAFAGMNWYEAVEKALYSYGAVLRYIGGNEVMLTTLRYLPSYGGNIDNITRIEPVFVTGAQRELTPAVKRIDEVVEYDLETIVSQPQVSPSDFSGVQETYRCKIDGIDLGNGVFSTLEHDAPIWSIDNGGAWSNALNNSLFFNPHEYEIGYFSNYRGLSDEIYRYMYIAANNVDDRAVSFSKSIACSDISIRIKFGQPVSLDKTGKLEQTEVFNLKKISYSVSLAQNGITSYLTQGGDWVATQQIINKDYDAKEQAFEFECFVGMGEFVGNAVFTFTIHRIEYAQTGGSSKAVTGLYASIQDFAIAAPESASLLQRNTVNTKYSDSNNVILSRDPELGAAYNAVALPSFIKNGIFYRNGDTILPAKAWSWDGTQEQHLALYNHLQLLCYHAKPCNVISGAIVNADLTRVNVIYEWHGAEHILVSGSYDFVSNRIEGAVLREFVRYDNMWRGANFPPFEENGTTNVGGGSGGNTGGNGGSGGSGGGTGGSVDLTGYATEIWVQEWVNGQGYLKGVEGSAFISVSQGDNIISLDVDPQGGLGATQQGLGIVDIPYDALENNLKTINGQSIVGKGNIIIEGGSGGEGIVIDGEMSDTSENAVQNKVIKEYVDLHPRYETIEEIVPPEEVEDFATKQWVRDSFTEPSDFKTINGQSIVGEGDIELNGGKVTLDTEMSDESENGVQNKVIKAYVDGKVETIDTAELINVTYEEMLEKSLMGKLTAGAKYRIIDYYTTVEQEGVMAETGQFDIVVVADSEYMVNEEAHPVDAYKTLQGYYAIGGAIYAWRIRYTLIPFYPTRFEWACFGDEYMVLAPEINVEVPFTRISPTYTEEVNGEQMYCFFSTSAGFPVLAYCRNADPQVGDVMLIEGNEYPISSIVPHERGKGVIYDMTDEWGNSAPYDFKNIKFRAYGSNVGGFTFEPRDGAYERWVHTFEGDDMIDASDAGNLDVTVPSGDFFSRMRFAVYNNKIKYFPVRLKPIVVHGDRSSYSDATTMFVDTQIHDNEFINCDRLSAFVNSNSVLRNCENVTIRYNGETFNDNIHIDCLKGTEGNPIVIDNLTTSEEYTTHIGKNSQGEVKIWNPADLV